MKLKESEKNELERMTLNKTDGLGLDDKGRSSAKGSKNMWNSMKDKAQTTVSLEKAVSYEEAFAKIEAATGIHDIDILVKNFI